jgi:hypothetical protein
MASSYKKKKQIKSVKDTLLTTNVMKKDGINTEILVKNLLRCSMRLYGWSINLLAI